MGKFRQDIQLTHQANTTLSTTFLPNGLNEGDTGLAEHDTADFDGVKSIFFEASLTMTQTGPTPDEAEWIEARLFEKGGSAITGSLVETPGDAQGTFRVRSGDIKANFSGAQELFVQYRTTYAGYQCQLTSARIIIIQKDAKKTAIYWMIGHDQTTGSGAYSEVTERRRMFLTKSNYDGTASYEWHATTRASGGANTFVELRNVTDGASITAVNSSNSSPTLSQSTGLTLTDSKEYTTRIKTSAGGTGTIRSSYFVIKLVGTNPLTKLVAPIQVFALRILSGSNTTYSTTNNKFGGWDNNDYANADLSIIHESSLKLTGGGVGAQAFCAVLEASTIDSSSENQTSSTSYIRQQNAYSPSATPNIDVDIKGHVSRTIPLGRYHLVSGRILVQLTNIVSGTNMQINIGDAWKTVPAMQINIGDAWKAVAGAQINIGDAWKTIF